MGSITPDFRFGNFVGSVIQLVLVILSLVTLLILPIIFFSLFFVPLPVIDGQVLTPYLFFSMVVDPARTLPIVQFLMHTDLFRAAVFPGFAFAALIAAIERLSPCWRRCTANSTIRMAFFARSPTSIMSAIWK